MSVHDDLTFLVNASRVDPHLREVVGRVENEVALLRSQRDAYSARVTEMEQALLQALDCKGPHEGTVAERGGYPAVCSRCAEAARSALAAGDNTTEPA